MKHPKVLEAQAQALLYSKNKVTQNRIFNACDAIIITSEAIVLKKCILSAFKHHTGKSFKHMLRAKLTWQGMSCKQSQSDKILSVGGL